MKDIALLIFVFVIAGLTVSPSFAVDTPELFWLHVWMVFYALVMGFLLACLVHAFSRKNYVLRQLSLCATTLRYAATKQVAMRHLQKQIREVEKG